MAIDRSGKWWGGSDFDDLARYLREITADEYVIREVRQSVCVCGGRVFAVSADPDEGCACRACIACGARAYIGDSEEYWADASPEPAICPCGVQAAEVGVGFAERGGGEIQWIVVGQRCTGCGVPGSWVDWEIDYAPTHHLRERIQHR